MNTVFKGISLGVLLHSLASYFVFQGYGSRAVPCLWFGLGYLLWQDDADIPEDPNLSEEVY